LLSSRQTFSLQQKIAPKSHGANISLKDLERY